MITNYHTKQIIFKETIHLEKVAVISLGTTKIDLVLSDVLPGGNFVVVDEMSETIKIGQDMEQDGFIKPARITEALSILKTFKTICDVNKVSNTIAVAVHNVKTIKNQRSFFEEIYNTCGFKFKILTEEEELTALYTGIINTLDIPKGLIIDVKGGSTNLVHYNRRVICNQVTIPMGSYTLTQLFENSKETPETTCSRMVELFKNELKVYDWLKHIEPEFAYIGAGSAFANIGKLSRKLKKYPLELAHNYPMTKADFDSVYDLIKTLDLDKTKKIKGISSDRADVLASGICIVKAVLETIDAQEFVISDKDEKEGLIFNYAVPITNEKPISDLLGYSLETINAFYDRKEDNAKQVGELALILFRQLKVLHKLSRGYLKVLRIASIMHDCGKRIKFYNHAKNSFNIILNSDIQGVTQREITLAAFVCSSQDSNEFSLAEWIKYKDILLEEDLLAVKKLAIIVRIAEALDKTHRNIVQDVSCDVLGDSVIMKTIVTADASIEIREALKASLDFKKAYGKNLEVL